MSKLEDIRKSVAENRARNNGQYVDESPEAIERRRKEIEQEEAEKREAERKEIERKNAEERKRQQEQERIRRAQAAAARTRKAIEDAGGTWEYKVVSLVDGDSGAIMPSDLEQEMNRLGREGWHLRCAYANEIGRNTSSTGMYGFSSGTNATVDQNVLIFERFIRLSD